MKEYQMLRTPYQTKKKVSRPVGGLKRAALYRKIVKVEMVGTNPAELQQVAQSIHIAASSHPLVSGGKEKRKVFLAKGISYIPTKVFEGVV
jgi:hypothetical protein